MGSNPTLTAERLREVLDYDPETGLFRRKEPRPGRHVGENAGGYTLDGYRRVTVDGTTRMAHVFAWLYVYGVWPTTELDHINGVTDDNRILNLREDPDRQNTQNQHRPHRGNTSGFLGVTWDKSRSKWKSQIMTEGRVLNLGRFDTPEAANSAYVQAKRELHLFWAETVD